MPVYRKILAEGSRLLEDAGIEDSRTDAWLLMESIIKMPRSRYFMIQEEKMPEEQEAKYRGLIEKRRSHIPVQQILGEAWFWGMRFVVNEHVLIPRQDTEVLITEVLDRINREREKEADCRILDMCTGSGCILISLLSEMKQATGTGVDVSSKALEIARKNGKDHEAKADWILSSLFTEVKGTYDVIVSNPPYIASKEIEKLSEEVKDHEPRLALDGMEDGLYFYRKITEEAGGYLNPGGILAYEIGYDQGKAVASMLEEAGYYDIKVLKDLAGLDRVVSGRK